MRAPAVVALWLAGAMALGGCSPEAPPQISFGGPDTAACKAVMDLPENSSCKIFVEFAPTAPQARETRLAAARDWLAAHQWEVGGGSMVTYVDGRTTGCMSPPSEQVTGQTYQALKSIGSSSAAGSMRICTDTGHSFHASDPVDHGGDEVRR